MFRKMIFLSVVCTAFLLSGCFWVSKVELFTDKEAVNPFKHARFLLWDHAKDADDSLLFERIPGDDEIFKGFMPSVKDGSYLKVKFLEIKSGFSLFKSNSSRKYIVNWITKENVEKKVFQYFYLEKKEGIWTYYWPSYKNTIELNSVSDLEDLIEVKKFDGKEVGYFQAIDSTRAALHRQIARANYEKKQLKKAKNKKGSK